MHKFRRTGHGKFRQQIVADIEILQFGETVEVQAVEPIIPQIEFENRALIAVGDRSQV